MRGYLIQTHRPVPATDRRQHQAVCLHSARQQHGVGMVGFFLAAMPVLGLGLGGAELAHWMNLRQTLSLNLMDAARAGITRQASPGAIAAAFEQSLHRLYPNHTAQSRVLAKQVSLGIPWQIRILQPTAAAFADHADHPGQPGSTQLATTAAPYAFSHRPGAHLAGLARIRNDYQALQHQQRLTQGWPQGRGPQSGQTIQQANTLSLELWWPQQALLPPTASLIRALAGLHPDPLAKRMMQHGYLPFKRRLTLSMQSDPLNWPDLPDGRVVHATPSSVNGSAPGNQPLPGNPAPPLPTMPDSPATGNVPNPSTEPIPDGTGVAPSAASGDGNPAGANNEGVPGSDTGDGQAPAPGTDAGTPPGALCAP
ncbi:MAG: hypothetical protein WBF60_11235 [Castellaniella sp.]